MTALTSNKKMLLLHASRGCLEGVQDIARNEPFDIDDRLVITAMFLATVTDSLDVCKFLFKNYCLSSSVLKLHDCMIPVAAIRAGNLNIFKYFVELGFRITDLPKKYEYHTSVYNDILYTWDDFADEYHDFVRSQCGFDDLRRCLESLGIDTDFITGLFKIIHDAFSTEWGGFADDIPCEWSENSMNYILGQAVRSKDINVLKYLVEDFGVDKNQMMIENMAALKWSVKYSSTEMFLYICNKFQITVSNLRDGYSKTDTSPIQCIDKFDPKHPIRLRIENIYHRENIPLTW